MPRRCRRGRIAPPPRCAPSPPFEPPFSRECRSLAPCGVLPAVGVNPNMHGAARWGTTRAAGAVARRTSRRPGRRVGGAQPWTTAPTPQARRARRCTTDGARTGGCCGCTFRTATRRTAMRRPARGCSCRGSSPTRGLGRDFRFEVDLLGKRPDIAPEALLGRRVTIALARDDGGLRHFDSHVFEFRFVRNDAGWSHYAMTLLPWLALLRLRRTSRIFHGSWPAPRPRQPVHSRGRRRLHRRRRAGGLQGPPHHLRRMADRRG